MKDSAIVQAGLLVLIVSAGIILEKWIVAALPTNGITTPIKKVISYI